MRGLNDKVAVVAGAAPGNIGAATAMRLASEGMKVMVGDLNAAAAEEVARQVRAAGGTASARQFDISNEASFAAVIGAAVSDYGGVDGLFNVAADLSANGLGRDTDVLSVPVEVWKHTIDVTLTGYFYGIRHVLPVMFECGGGSIINTMSSSIWMGRPNFVSYAASKSALAALTQHTATIGGKKGVRCNAVAPGTVLTASLRANLPEEEQRVQLDQTRSTRLGVPEDIAALVAFLFSDDAAWINAQIIIADGGLIRQR